MKTTGFPLLIFALGLCVQSTPLSAAVVLVTDPTLYSGATAINPSNRTLVEASGATSAATLEAMPGFSAIHDFQFAGNQSTSNEYVFDFTSFNAVDVRIRYSGSAANNTVQVTNVTFSTSSSSSLRYAAANNASTVGLRIDFGTYDADADAFTADKTVKAMGFTLPSGPATDPVTVTISYYDALNNLLSSQAYTTSSSSNAYGYTGYESTGAPISYALLSYTTAGSVPVVTLDDLGFAVVPEPQVALLLAAASVMGVFGRRRRSSQTPAPVR
jgi:hypothetical protein